MKSCSYTKCLIHFYPYDTIWQNLWRLSGNWLTPFPTLMGAKMNSVFAWRRGRCNRTNHTAPSSTHGCLCHQGKKDYRRGLRWWDGMEQVPESIHQRGLLLAHDDDGWMEVADRPALRVEALPNAQKSTRCWQQRKTLLQPQASPHISSETKGETAGGVVQSLSWLKTAGTQVGAASIHNAMVRGGLECGKCQKITIKIYIFSLVWFVAV